VPPDDARSNFAMAQRMLLSHVSIPTENVHRMPADAGDLDAAARDYERALGGRAIDLLVLGIGGDGHTASLFPGDATVEVRDRLVVPVAAADGREARLTITAPVIESARHILVLASGAEKRGALERAWRETGDVRQTPARILRACADRVTWIVDEAAMPR
jgi:6-phosphogluconolactonase